MPEPACRCISHAGVSWKTCWNSCSVPAGASVRPTLALDSPLYSRGPMAAVILVAAAGIAAPLFIIMVVLVLVPWLPWVFPKLHGLRETRARCCITSGGGEFCSHDRGIYLNPLPVRHSRLDTWGPDPVLQSNGGAEWQGSKNEKKPGGRQATGRIMEI
jgi:hypothetical protein